jgi:hypothetical protein
MTGKKGGKKKERVCFLTNPVRINLLKSILKVSSINYVCSKGFSKNKHKMGLVKLPQSVSNEITNSNNAL